MPCYNGERFLNRSLASALGQTFEAIEVIVIDDGSKDRSAEIALAVNDPRLRVVRQENKGASAARNKGISISRGDYLAFLDADDTWDCTFLEKLHASISCHRNALLVYCGWQNVGLEGGPGQPYIPPDYENGSKWELMLMGCPWPIHAVLVRRHAVLAAGGFDATLKTSEDYLLWLRIAAQGKVARVPEVLAYYYFHEGDHACSDTAALVITQLETQQRFLKETPMVAALIGETKALSLIRESMLKRAFNLYWHDDLRYAQRIFRYALKNRIFTFSKLKYLLPALLPEKIYQGITSFSRHVKLH